MGDIIKTTIAVKKDEDPLLYEYLKNLPARHRAWELKKLLSNAIEGKTPTPVPTPTPSHTKEPKETKKPEPKIPIF